MSYLEYPHLGEALHQMQLPNGLRIRIVPKKDFAQKTAFLAIDFGSIDTHFILEGKEYRVPDGIAHYLEHKMFDLPEENATNRFAELGASVNAFTSYAMTAYHFSCTDAFEECLSLLLRMVTTPYFTEESVEKERGIIEQEIRMYEDSPESRVYEDLFRVMFPEHPVHVPIAGTVESIAQIDAQMLYRCHKAFYQPSNMVLCVTGDVDAEEVFRIAEENTPEGCAAVPQRCYGSAERLESAVSTRRSMQISMPTLCLAFSCSSVSGGLEGMRRELIGEIASEILVGESSPLFTRLYEEGLIDSDFSAGYESIKDLCLLSVSGDSRDPQAVYKAILEEGKRIAEEGFEEELFRRLLRSSQGRRTRDLDSFSSICYRICAYEFESFAYFRFPEAYASITAADVQSFLKETVWEEHSALSVVYPKEG